MAVCPEIKHGQPLMSFHSTVSLNALQGLEDSRSEAILDSTTRRKQRIEDAKVKTVWDIKPIDFSVKIYQPHPPPRNSRESMMNVRGDKELHTALKVGRNRLIDPSVPQLSLPTLLIEKEMDERPNFKAKFKSPSPQASEILFIREGKFKPDRYVTDSVGYHRRDLFRKLEDFRQYHKFGIYDFQTSYPRDPLGIKFKHEMLSMTLPELSTTKQIAIRTCESEPIKRLRHPSNWEKDLHHPKSAYKKGRSAQSALMERIQAKIGWTSHNDKIGRLERPDIKDHKTKDWCDITGAPDEKDGPFPLA